MSQGEGDRFTLLLLVVLKSASPSDVRLTTSLGNSHGPGARLWQGVCGALNRGCSSPPPGLRALPSAGKRAPGADGALG